MSRCRAGNASFRDRVVYRCTLADGHSGVHVDERARERTDAVWPISDRREWSDHGAWTGPRVPARDESDDGFVRAVLAIVEQGERLSNGGMTAGERYMLDFDECGTGHGLVSVERRDNGTFDLMLAGEAEGRPYRSTQCSSARRYAGLLREKVARILAASDGRKA